MVQVFLNEETYAPGDEVRIALSLSRSDAIQLLSVRCMGYARLPNNIARDIPDRTKYSVKDKPGGPAFPEDSVLLWLTPNFPVHVDFLTGSEALVKIFIPYFLPPSIRGGLFEVCHYLELSILNRGEFEMRTKRLPLNLSVSVSMPKLLCPTVGDGYEQMDFGLAPAHQSTAHGKRASGWEAVTLLSQRKTGHSASGIFKSQRGYRISFNHQHAAEILAHGEWVAEKLLVHDGNPVTIVFRFDQPVVHLKRVVCRLVRIERIKNRDDQVHELVISESTPLAFNPFIVETCHTVHVPRLLCPSFDSDVLTLDYRIDFELRAMDADSGAALDPVIWSLPVFLARNEEDSIPRTDPWPAHPFGSIAPLVPLDEDQLVPDSALKAPASLAEAEIEAVKFNSLAQPGSMRFTIYSLP